MDKNIYKIAETEFVSNDDLDLDESLEASRLLKIFFFPSTITVIAETTGDEIKRFMEIVLIPANGKPLPEGFNFGKAKESVQIKIFMDFFLARIRKGVSTAEEFSELMTQQMKQSMN